MKTILNPDSIQQGSITPEMLSSEVLSPITEELNRKVETYILDITISSLNALIDGRIDILTPDVQALEDAISNNKRIAIKMSPDRSGLFLVNATVVPGVIQMIVSSLAGTYSINLPSSGGLQASAVQIFPFISSKYVADTEQAIRDLRNKIEDFGRDKYILDFTIDDLNSLRDGDIEFIQFDAMKLHDEVSRKTVYIKNEGGSDGLLPVGIYEEDFTYMVVLTYTGTYCVALPFNGKLYADSVSFVKSGEIAEIHELIESLQTQLDSHDVAIEDLQDNKVDKGDYAPALTAGFADNLVSKDIVVDSEFNLRRSGGGAISDGVARMEVVKGNSVVWNQQLRPLSSTGWYANPTDSSSEYSDNYCKLTIAREASALAVNGVAITATTTNRKPALPNHAYLITAEIKVSVAISVGIRNYTSPWGGDYRKNAQANQWTRVAFIDKPTELYNGYVIVGTTTNIGLSIGDTIEIRNVAVVDLTQMFGAGNEPTTIEEFYARKPIVEDEYAYNEGEVIHCNVDAVKSVGRNVWDEKWELGAYNSNNGEKHATTSKIRNVNPISVLPNQKYYIASPISHVYFYDVDYQYIKNTYTGGIGTELQIPINAAFLNFESMQNVVTYNHDICINLSDPDFNGQYEPYKEDVRELPSAIKEVFPNGMMSAGTAHDVAYNDLNKEVGVTEKRIGVVDMGTLNWGMISASDGNVLFRATLKDRADAVSDLLSALCSKYIVVKQFKRTDKTISGAGSSVVDVIDSAYTDAASFKAAMAGVMLYYELAEPIVTEHQEPFNLDYQVTNGGQEQAMATEQTSAFKAEIAYGFNASAKIKENANEIASLKATIAQLQAALASMVNANTED